MNNSSEFIFGTKAETLEKLQGNLRDCEIPDFIYFSTQEWDADRRLMIENISDRFGGGIVAVRSSALDEDGAVQTMAGRFESVLHVSSSDDIEIIDAVQRVIASYERNAAERDIGDQIIVQRMVNNVLMSGVLFTQEMNTGAPYYVINYDDETGTTDTVTAGLAYSNRTLYVHRESIDRVRSRRFSTLLKSVLELEQYTNSRTLDIEFAVDRDFLVQILQVRPITTVPNWNRGISNSVHDTIKQIETFVSNRFRPIRGVCGSRSVFGQMPDWNPAEIIGRVPRPLAFSLYRHLVTDHAWRIARAQMGYANPYGQPLLTSLGGQPYVDVRLSFHSFLPAELSTDIGTKLVDAWLERLVVHPELHDKVEFDVATTVLSFDFDKQILDRYPNALSNTELEHYRELLQSLTSDLVRGKQSPISEELKKIDRLNRNRTNLLSKKDDFDIATVSSLLEDCIIFGTIPFAVLARHAFIGHALLRSLVRLQILKNQEANMLLRSIRTIASEFTDDGRLLAKGTLSVDEFLQRYGHLRPGTYDILSPRYDQRHEILDFDLVSKTDVEKPKFLLNREQSKTIDRLLIREGFGIDAESLLRYIKEATRAREFAKFIFSRNLSDALEGIAAWGNNEGLNRNEVSYLEIRDILDSMVRAGGEGTEHYLRNLSIKRYDHHKTTQALRLPQLLHNTADLHVVPLQLSIPNFITSEIVRGKCIQLNGISDSPEDIKDAIVLIENADPGFDWIFAHRVLGLVTKFGGVNSHMAIRCAEFGVPAAIGCGEQIFERVACSPSVEINCAEGHIRPFLE